jgi:hypothetical protein
VKSLRQTYILRVWNAAPHGAPVDVPQGAPLDAPLTQAQTQLDGGAGSTVESQNAGEGKVAITADDVTAAGLATDAAAERFYCSLQAVASEEIHYFATLEETMRFLRNNALAFRFKPK